ncbi:MAG: hypothetical protein GX567_07640 [Clostridia bacterium]|nr:hypothetical protein [Clostridia bacterium]
MKKAILIFMIFMYPLIVHNSDHYVIYISESTPIIAYSDLVYAINMVESGIDSTSYDIFAYNESEGATGAFQIRQCKLDDYNKLTGQNIKLNDLYDYNKSFEIFLYFARAYGKDYETIAKKWNGSGPMTEIYWNKVKEFL